MDPGTRRAATQATRWPPPATSASSPGSVLPTAPPVGWPGWALPSSWAAGILDSPSSPRKASLTFDSPAPGNDIFSRSILHLSRARWFEAIGDVSAALREILWYENSDVYRFPDQEAQKMEVDAVASVAARVTRARLLLQTNEPAEACRMLDRVHQLWLKADASLAPSRAEADSLRRAGCP